MPQDNPIHAVSHFRVRQVLAVPREQKIHPVNRRRRQMKRIACRLCGNRPLFYQRACQSGGLYINFQKRQSRNERQAFLSFRFLPGCRLVDYHLGNEEIKILPSICPPFLRRLLVRGQ